MSGWDEERVQEEQDDSQEQQRRQDSEWHQQLRDSEAERAQDMNEEMGKWW